MITVTRVDASTVEWRDEYGDTHHGYAEMVLAHPEEYPTAVVQAAEYGSTDYEDSLPMSADEADVLRLEDKLQQLDDDKYHQEIREAEGMDDFPTIWGVYITPDTMPVSQRMNWTTETREAMEEFIYQCGEGDFGDWYRNVTFTIVRYEPSPWL